MYFSVKLLRSITHSNANEVLSPFLSAKIGLSSFFLEERSFFPLHSDCGIDAVAHFIDCDQTNTWEFSHKTS